MWPAAARAAISDPPANRALSQSTIQACQSPTSQGCEVAALADLDAARAAEGVGPMQLPGDYGVLTVAQQLLVLSNLERVDRGLAPVIGLSGPLDQDALTGAQNDADPMPSQTNGNAWSANWEGGYASPLEADFEWMYDDGFGSDNIDCTSPSDPGCWGHRRDILFSFDSPVVMGAAAAGQSGASQTELFMGGDRDTAPGQADAPLAPTWATIAATLPFGVSPTSVALPSTPSSANVTVSASGQDMTIAASLPAAPAGWTVVPASCSVVAGASCTFTVTAEPAASGTVTTLTLQGPNGAQQVSLSKQGVTLMSTTTKARTIISGAATRISGNVLRTGGTGAPGLPVELTQRRAGSSATTTIAHATTAAHGAVSFTVRPRVNTTYRLVFTGTPTLSASTGTPVRIGVAPRITAAFARSSVPSGTAAHLSGRVTPAPGRRHLGLQVKRGRRWLTIAAAHADRSGRYRFTIRPHGPGRTTYRVAEAATATTARGTSPARVLQTT